MPNELPQLRDFRPTAILRVRGEDAFSFLQGQFSNELRQPIGSVVYGLWLNQKGRVVAESHVLRLGDNEFLIFSASSPADVIRKRLEDYIVADDVNLADETAAGFGVEVSGAGSAALVRDVTGLAGGPGRFAGAGGVWIIPGLPAGGDNLTLLGAEATLSAWKKKLLEHGATMIDPDAARFARIAAGIPLIPQELGPGDLPNEAGLEATAISFTKGCYLGQEVMARLKNLGQVRRRLHRLRGRGALPEPLAALFQGPTRVGEIRAAARGDAGFAALAMLSLVKLDPRGELSLAPDASPTLTLVDRG